LTPSDGDRDAEDSHADYAQQQAKADGVKAGEGAAVTGGVVWLRAGAIE
jgi:hypothetical protein